MKFFTGRKERNKVDNPEPGTHGTDNKKSEHEITNYVEREELQSYGTHVVFEIMEKKKKRIGTVILLCLLVVGIAGGMRFYLGRQSDDMVKRYMAAGNKITRELENLSKRMEEVQSLARVGRGLPLINQYSLLTAALYESMAIRNIQYDHGITALRDVFFIETGRPADEVEHGGLWTIDAISLSEDGIQRFIRNIQSQSQQILNMKAYINYSSGQSRTGASASQLVRVVFWR